MYYDRYTPKCFVFSCCQQNMSRVCSQHHANQREMIKINGEWTIPRRCIRKCTSAWHWACDRACVCVPTSMFSVNVYVLLSKLFSSVWVHRTCAPAIHVKRCRFQQCRHCSTLLSFVLSSLVIYLFGSVNTIQLSDSLHFSRVLFVLF